VKVINKEFKEDKVLVTLELTKQQDDFVTNVGLGVLIQQGAMAFLDLNTAAFADEEKVVNPASPETPKPAGE
jgi:hypothetical protein